MTVEEESPTTTTPMVSSEVTPMIAGKAVEWKAPGQFFDGTHYVLHTQPSNPQAELILCVHGIGSYHTCFSYLVEAFIAKGYAVLTYDLIGRGYSATSKNGLYGRAEHIQQLVALVEHLQITKPMHVIGHSMGGCLSTLFASEHPDKVKSLTLIAPAGLLGYFPLQFIIDCCGCIRGTLKRSMAPRANQEVQWRKAFTKKGSVVEESIADMHHMYDNNPHAFDAFFSSVGQFPLTNITADIKKVAQCTDLPIYLQWGPFDTACPFSNLAKWERLINQERKQQGLLAQKLVIKEAGHGLLIDFHEECVAGILRFLEESTFSSAVVQLDVSG